MSENMKACAMPSPIETLAKAEAVANGRLAAAELANNVKASDAAGDDAYACAEEILKAPATCAADVLIKLRVFDEYRLDLIRDPRALYEDQRLEIFALLGTIAAEARRFESVEIDRPKEYS